VSFDHKKAGRKAASTQRFRYGIHIFEAYAREGGLVKCPKGFAVNRELAVEMGKRAGQLSARRRQERALLRELRLSE
jgi:hypothetical protein